jgi:NADH dehydrogenase FAD-containing subunit
MGVTVSLPLFGEPGRELGEGSDLTGRQLRELAVSLHERLDKAAAALDTLEEAGWSVHVALFDAILQHSKIETREDAERRLRESGVDPEALIIVEDVDEEEELD